MVPPCNSRSTRGTSWKKKSEIKQKQTGPFSARLYELLGFLAKETYTIRSQREMQNWGFT